MKNLKKLPLILSLLSFLTIFAPANAEIKVVAAIKPIHSLASYLMDGVGKPDLIVATTFISALAGVKIVSNDNNDNIKGSFFIVFIVLFIKIVII